MTSNASKDIVSGEVVEMIAPVYVDSRQRNNYSEPIRAGLSWWKAFPAKKILNIYGEHEVFKDDIVTLGRRFKDVGRRVKTVECEKHVHIDAILDEQAGLEAGEMAEEVVKWLSGMEHDRTGLGLSDSDLD
jgi:acetyl esterase/lipase